MRLLPRSLTGRLVMTALVATALALGFAALSIGPCARTARSTPCAP